MKFRKPDAVPQNVDDAAEFALFCQWAACAGSAILGAFSGMFLSPPVAMAMLDFFVQVFPVGKFLHDRCGVRENALERARSQLRAKHESLLSAVDGNRLGEARSLLEEGHSPSGYDGAWRSPPPLMLAVQKGHADMVDVLLEYGADPNPENVLNPPARHAREWEKNMRIYRALVLAGARDDGTVFRDHRTDAGVTGKAFEEYHIIRQDGDVLFVADPQEPKSVAAPQPDIEDAMFVERPDVQKRITWERKTRYPLQKLPVPAPGRS
ncbi:MAG: hypothetical protein A2018_03780 [Alphaproteobacteria bacterium GWF2_58_20]|nr:MAG: hypothetical protein A2018_03780 [Alphaproteobacteria bacterium GWF2_58_20]